MKYERSLFLFLSSPRFSLSLNALNDDEPRKAFVDFSDDDFRLWPRVEDDELAVAGPTEEMRGNNGKFDRLKRKIKEDFSKVSEDGYRGG